MEPNNPPQPPPATPQPPLTQPIMSSPIKYNNPVLMMIILLLALGVAGFFAYQNWQLKQQIAQVQPAPTTLITPTTTADPTTNWKIYTNQKLGFTIKYPPTVIITRELNDEFNRATEFKGSEISFEVMLRKTGAISLNNYYYMDSPILQKAFLDGNNANVYAYNAVNNTCVNDESGPSCPTSFIAYVAENGPNIYHISFYGDDKLSPLENQILSTFKFTNQNQTVTTNDWKTYSNKILKYTIKYPNDWTIDTSKAELPISTENSQELNISKGTYKLTILWPSAYGPGICLFDDQSRSGAPEMASYCEGKYIELSSNGSKELHRRLVKPETFGDHQQWEVYTKEKSYFVTVPIIRFTAPLNFVADQVEIMDQILSTYTSTN